MKNSTYKNLFGILKFKTILAVSGSLLLVSCGSQMGGYTETDGVYYDPNKDVISEGIVMPETNTVDEVYTYDNDSINIIEQNKQNQQAKRNKYNNWNNIPESDWGNYAGTENNYYYNDWGYPYYGMYPSYYGWGSRWSIGFSFGSPWNYYGYNPYYWDSYWGGFYPNYYGYYNPWYNYYSPYYGGYYGGYYGYNPYNYRDYYSPRYYNYKRSGADSIDRSNGFQNSGSNRGFNRMAPNSQNNQNEPRGNDGFRRSGFGNQNPNNVTPQQPQQPSNRGFRRTSDYTPSQQPSYNAPKNENQRSGSDNGGFRSSGGFGGGSSSSGSSSRSSSSGGGFRSGGFR